MSLLSRLLAATAVSCSPAAAPQDGESREQAREQMVKQQLETREVRDRLTLAAVRKVPRHLFVPAESQRLAYEDYPLPIGHGQTISQPYIVAFMTEALGLVGGETVLEIGTGSGYQTAVLAELARRVCSVERLGTLATRARGILEDLGYTNAVVRIADGTYGWPDEAPFERIVVTAGAPAVPGPLFQQLAEGGMMLVPVGDAQTQTLHVIQKVDGRMRTALDCGCVFVKLVGRYGWEN
jgi:protein-L-isoaspartate(D-aspartate) O-methyltransferase